jgi:hypothetical protein
VKEYSNICFLNIRVGLNTEAACYELNQAKPKNTP